jgi:hypothetical protein
MGNSILTINQITRESLRILHNNLHFAKNVNRQYDDSFAKSGAKIGNTLRIRLPNQYTVRTGAALSAQDTEEESVSLSVSTQKGVDVTFTTEEMTMELDDFSQRILAPAMARLASEIDKDGLAQYVNVYNAVGTAGSVPQSALVWLQAGAKLDDFACPRDDMRAITMSPGAQAYTVDALKGLFQQSNAIANQYADGEMGRALGFKWGMDQNVPSHTVGAHAGNTIEINGSTLEGATQIVCDGAPSSVTVYKRGDVITIEGVYSVNPETKISTGSLAQFVVTEDAVSVGADVTVKISPALITTGAKQTVTALPANNADVTVIGATGATLKQNLAYHRDAFILGMADLILPGGVDMAGRSSKDGMSIRMVRAYDINNDKLPARLDVLYGWLTARPELACRVVGGTAG